jgi:hypothetical protein
MLSDRLRDGIEASQWVIDEVKQLEKDLIAAYAELNKIRPAVKAIFDREVWDKAKNGTKQLIIT